MTTTYEEVRRAAMARDAADAAAIRAAASLRAARASKRSAHAEFTSTLVNAHATGASLRSLAALTGLAHQRVHQIVQAGTDDHQ